MKIIRWLLLLGSVVLALVGRPATMCRADDARNVDFNRDIRPLLSNNCFKCHGPDERERQTTMRLDRKESVFDALESGGRPVVPADRASSQLYQRISTTDVDQRMPPVDSGKSLTLEQIEMISRWIDQGAPWSKHWSLEPPRRAPAPDAEPASWPRNTIDHFVLARLRQAGLMPSLEASKETLIRRVTLDLTGLPPTLDELDAFLADNSEEAYEKLVDRLLKSPRYGEQMARYWLDAARYGDTHGLHLDNRRTIWPYRDWVIRAFNQNMPFDQFTIEQLAGDLLPDPTPQQLVATGFNRCNITTSEGGAIAQEYLVRYAIDRVETTATVWMGLTAGCAVCHDHKFDPLSQQEFYQLFAYFFNLSEKAMDGNAELPPPTTRAITSAQERQLREYDDRTGQLSARMRELENIDLPLRQWERRLVGEAVAPPEAPEDMVLHCPLDQTEGAQVELSGSTEFPGEIRGQSDWTVGILGRAIRLDGRSLIDLGDRGRFERGDAFSYGAWVYPDSLDQKSDKEMTVLARMDDQDGQRGYDLFLLDGKPYAHLIHAWPKNAIQVHAAEPLVAGRWQHVMVTYDGSSKAAGMKIYVDGIPQSAQVTHDNLSGEIVAQTSLQIGQRSTGAPLRGRIDDVRIYARQLSDDEVGRLVGHAAIDGIVPLPLQKRSEEQQQWLATYYLHNHDPEYKKVGSELADQQKRREALYNSIPQTLIMQDMPQRRQAHVLIRGGYDTPGEPVEPNVPAAFPSLPADAPPNRLTLARWLSGPTHPLTARVTVNRFWQQYFGAGIVKTSEDFGSQGEWPSHPQLLDWLATELITTGWDVKRMQKLIVMSATYRQSGRVTDELLSKDRFNRLLGRGPRFRMDAEMVRDNALAISGLLIETIGGPSVRPYQPDGLWSAVGYSDSNTVRFTQDHGDALYRRSMYTFWKRTSPPPTMQIFDAPSREVCVVRRERTNTPKAALALMNDVQYVEAACHFAQRMIRSGGDTTSERIEYGFRLATSRRPGDQELAVLQRMIDELLEHYRVNRDAAEQLVGVGESPRDEQLDVSELAAWTILANAILNLDETISKG